MTVFHELLNKKCKPFALNIGKPIMPDALVGDTADLTARLQKHTVITLRDNPEATFQPD